MSKMPPNERAAAQLYRTPRACALAALVLAAGNTALTACTAVAPQQTTAPSPSTHIMHQSVAADWGIEIVALMPSAAGYMLDLRYRVHDPDKAAPLLKRDAKSYLIVGKNGAQLAVLSAPRIGQLRQSASKVYSDRNYFVLFANPGKMVVPGDLVTVVIGDFQAEHRVLGKL